MTELTNAFLRPPAAQMIELMATASREQGVADALVQCFADPPAMWRAIATPQGAADLIAGAPRRSGVMEPSGTG